MRLKLKKAKYIIKTQNLVKSSADGCIAVRDEITYSKMNEAMFRLKTSLFNPIHKSHYTEKDLTILDDGRTIAPVGLFYAYSRVNDPMAKLQFLRVGWGGVGMMTFFELEHMLDAKQLCLSCHCTHAGCYATVFVLSLHTCWMLRNCVCLVIAHMLDATQLRLSCHCTHAGCYATVFVLSLHTCWMLRNCVCLVIANMLDAMQLCLSCHCTHAGCYATVFVLSLHTCWMLRNCVCLVIAHMLDATQLCLSCHCTHAGCYATVFVLRAAELA